MAALAVLCAARAECSQTPDGLSDGEWGSIGEQIRAAQYQVTWQQCDGVWAYRAPNRAQQMSMGFGAEGSEAVRYGQDGGVAWQFGLRLEGYGGDVRVSADREKVEYRWGDGVTEWYENRPDGVKHGITLASPPDGTDGATITLTYAIHGSLTPQLDAAGQILHLHNADGGVELLYDQLAVFDATGRQLPSHFELSSRAEENQTPRLHIVIDTTDAVYPITVDPLLHREGAILHASDRRIDDYFGYSVSISGDTLVVGAYKEDGGAGDPTSASGAAYVFTRNEGGESNWGEVTILRASDAQALDQFGGSVSISGDTLVVGAEREGGGAGDPLQGSGAAYVFGRNQGGSDNWGEVEILRASNAFRWDMFGCSVSICGDTVIVGAVGRAGAANDSGAAYVFERNQGGADNWGEVTILYASDGQEDDVLGRSVSISGDTVVVGADGEDGGPGDPAADCGAAYVFRRNQGGADNWGQVSIVRAFDREASDFFGRSVSISSDTLVVGAEGEDGGTFGLTPGGGAAYVFGRNHGGADNWGQVMVLHASDAQEDDHFGQSVSISGDTLVVGADGEDGEAGNPTFNGGAAYVFARNQDGADNWGQVKVLRASDTRSDDHFGYSVATSGDTLVVGAYRDDGFPRIDECGAAYVFATAGGAWQEAHIARAADRQAGDEFGHAVSISGDTLVVSADGEDGGAGDPLFNSGAAYVFARNGGGADNWGVVKVLRASDAQAHDYFGRSVSISGDVLVVGAHGEDGGAGNPTFNGGAAYVFARNEGGADNWGQVKILHASDAYAYDYFGWSLSISGDTLVVGAWGEDGGVTSTKPESGAAYVFRRNEGGADNWGQVKILRASDNQAGDNFGWSVSISGDVLLAGAVDEDGGAGDPLPGSGAAYVFLRNLGGADNWGLGVALRASDRQADDNFGSSVSVSGDTLVIGADGEDGGAGDPLPSSGAAYVFEANSGQVAILRGSDAQANDHFGWSVSISGAALVVGAYEEDGGTGDPSANSGAAYVFERNRGGADSWGEVKVLRASDARESDRFGRSVSISGDTLVAGAAGEDGGPGNPLANSGAAYIYRLDPFRGLPIGALLNLLLSE